MLLNPTVAGTAFSWNAGTNTRVQTALPTNATTVLTVCETPANVPVHDTVTTSGCVAIVGVTRNV
jgi:hypothetical protein